MTSRADSSLLHEWDERDTDPYQLSAGEAWSGAIGEDRSVPGEPSRSEAPSARPEAALAPGGSATWRPLGLFWGVLLAAAGLVAVGLEIAGPPASAPGPRPAAQPLPAPAPPSPMFPPLASAPAVTPREPPPQALPPAAPIIPRRPPMTDNPAAPLARPPDATAGSRPPPAPDATTGPRRPPIADNSTTPLARPPDAAAGSRPPPAPDLAASPRRPSASDTAAAPPSRLPDPTAVSRPSGTSEPAAPESPRSGRNQAAFQGGSPPDRAQPASPLLIHYPSGSYATLTDAQRLAEQANLGAEPVVVADGGTASPAATIKYFDAQDHAAAQALGKTLAKLGYKWRIERATNQPPAALEVFMPVK